jgi:hypothetical protein
MLWIWCSKHFSLSASAWIKSVKAPPGEVALNGNENNQTHYPKERQAVDNYAKGLEEKE